ncbi:hypothetical protein [Spirosoma endbachense]|uniref:Aerotolerance regulator N-terminal domain-containing protein n=1 Tax=Spirosoma endbachense TaxID=2666025 RepID=A0A6P1VQZ6_9BACT|nr:hypothetical protein [Spirosoma endbachense]QHV93786.1 hypothetical protein GJR95_01515 [Spirosoma endbachense]
MISFHFDRTDLLTWLILVLVVILLLVQVWLTLRNDSLTTQRRSVRLTLNVLLWLVLLGYVLQPVWTVTASSTHALLAGEDVPGTFRQKISDSLKVRQVVTARTFNSERFDSVTLVGQDFPPELLSRLSRQVVRWIPYYAPDQMQAVRWKSIVQKGEMQQVVGSLQSSQKQRIKLMYGGRTLDSLNLPKGFTSFSLQFPAFTLGRTEAELVLDQTTLDTIRFFTRPMKSLTYQFILGTPDFESRTLADWLGKNGNSVQITATLSKDVSNQLTINRASKKPDVIVTDPTNAGNVVVKRAIAEGKSVLFINLTNPEADCRLINKALGSNLQVRKVSNEPLVPVSEGLNALPFSIVPTVAQAVIPGYPVVVQQVSGKVGVSLLNETFPLKLSGDSLAYNRVWNAILAQLQPSAINSADIEAPVFAGFREAVHVNNVPARPSIIQLGNDTVQMSYSPINPLSAEGKFKISKAGWMPVLDSLATYAEGNGLPAIAQSRLVRAYAMAHALDQSGRTAVSRVTENHLPDWVWLVVFIVCLSGLWVEPKLG